MYRQARTETETLICRFLSGDLPLFACEQLLATQLPADLPADASMRHSILHTQLSLAVPPGMVLEWQVEQALGWVIANEPRAGLGVSRLAELSNAGLSPLSLFQGALAAGKQAGVFDWEAVKAQIPGLKASAQSLLDALISGHAQIISSTQWHWHD